MPRTGRKPGRPSGRKPLLNLRVPAPLLSHIKRTARKNGLTITEEATRRLQQSLDRSDADFAEIVAGVVMPALREAIERSDCWAAIAMKNQKLLMTKLQQTDAAAGNPLGAPPMRETTRPPHDSAKEEITHTAPALAAGGYLIDPASAAGVFAKLFGPRRARKASKGFRRHARQAKANGSWRGGSVSPLVVPRSPK